MKVKKIKIKYEGRRFPKIVSLWGGGKKSFMESRREMTLGEYDALFLLKSNKRMTPEKWEFTVLGVTEVEVEEKKAVPETVGKKKEDQKEEPKKKPERPKKVKKMAT